MMSGSIQYFCSIAACHGSLRANDAPSEVITVPPTLGL
jgi:hypothetical protein